MYLGKRAYKYVSCLPRICLSRCVLAAAGSIEGQRYIDLGSTAGDVRLEQSPSMSKRL
jgi:hypothetical protein